MNTEILGRTLVVTFEGRLDAQACKDAEQLFVTLGDDANVIHVIFDVTRVNYMSSASLRLFMMMQRWCAALDGGFSLVGLQPYCRDVLRISGAEHLFPIHSSRELAIAAADEGGTRLEVAAGTFEFHHLSDHPGHIEVRGDWQAVSDSRVTAETVQSHRLSVSDYGFGIGALGPSIEEILPRLGESVTLGGTVVWRAAGEVDAPDFLIPRAESDTVLIHAAYDVSLQGEFGQVADFEAHDKNGASLADVVAAVLDQASRRDPEFRGVLGIVMRAEVSEAYCAKLRHPPILQDGSPETGTLETTVPASRFEVDADARHIGGSIVVCGLGIDEEIAGRYFDLETLPRPLAPESEGDRPKLRLINYAVFFGKHYFPRPSRELEAEIEAIIEEGSFVDMGSILGHSRMTRARIGVIPIAEIRSVQFED